jgi:toxin ParE1/3/4
VKVRWTLPAVSQLQGVFEHIAEDNPAVAGRMVQRIRKTISHCAQMPYSGRIGRVAETREITVPGTSYLVAYRITENTVHVLAILHGAQQ